MPGKHLMKSLYRRFQVAEINITNMGDLQKLNGMVLDKAEQVVLLTGEPAIRLILKHVTLENKQALTIFPKVTCVAQAPSVTITPAISINVSPIV